MYLELNNNDLTEICYRELNTMFCPTLAENESYAKYDTGNNSLNCLLLTMNKLINMHYNSINSRFNKGKKNILADTCRALNKIFNTFDILKRKLNEFSIILKFEDIYNVRYNELNGKLPNTLGSSDLIENTIEINRVSPIFILERKNDLKCIKNVIFASSKKPDIYFDEMLENKIIIANELKGVFLIYDRQIDQGVTISEMNDWFLSKNKNESYQTLSKRLQKNLNDVEKRVLNFYFNKYGKNDMNKPAIFPQVYLHYDPKTIKEIIEDYNGKKRVTFQRMDFLILYNGKRVVIEIDGKEHFTQNGKDYDINKYSEQVAYDRKMKFLGYDIFRIGGKELYDNFDYVMKDFFDRLLFFLNVSK